MLLKLKKISYLSVLSLFTLFSLFLVNNKAFAYTGPNGFEYNFETKDGYNYLIFPSLPSYESNGIKHYNISDWDEVFQDAILLNFNYEIFEVVDNHGDIIYSFGYNTQLYITNYGPGEAEFETYNGDFFTINPQDDFAFRFKLPYVDKVPVIDGQTAFVTNVDIPISETEIRSHITAYDNEDGDITNRIQLLSDNYTVNKNTLGTYEIKYSVSDTAGNITNLTVSVLVKDITKPVISGKNTYTQSMTKLLSIDTIKTALSATDNYDQTLSILLQSDNYTANYNKLGTYDIVYKVTDSSGNTGNYTVKVTVIDDVKPTISGPTTIVKGQTEKLTITEIKSQLTANDNWDGNITDKIVIDSDNYTGNGHLTGTYEILFSVTDNSGNKITKTVTITVMDNIPPVFYVDNYFITIQKSLVITQEEIIDLLTRTGQINITTQSTVMTILNEYEGNENQVGMYAMSFRIASIDGSEQEESIVINVVDDTNQGGIDLEPEVEITHWYDFIIDFFVWIWEFILRCFNWIKNLF